uniref:Uncharacterized protein n=1 Tax=Aegilops tauschii TaxID=37682 RepID=R7W2Z0_AEGTA
MGITLSSMQRRLQQARDLLLQIPWRKTPQATLPSDVIFDILSRVPAKSMCRFRIRCVSRECRDRISDPVFIAAAQKRRPPEQLLVVGSDRDMSLRLVDMDGSVVRVIDGMSRRWVPVSTSPDGFVCVTTGFSKDDNLAGVIDLTTMKMPVTHLKSDRAWGYGRAVTSGAYKMEMMKGGGGGNVPRSVSTAKVMTTTLQPSTVRRSGGYTNIWLLKDHHKSVWVKAYTIPLDTSAIDHRQMMPLRILLDDGSKLLFYNREKGQPPELHIYDRRHGTYRNATKELLGNDHISGIGFCSLHLESFLSAEFQCPVSSSYFS